MTRFRADDRILMLAIPSAIELAAISRVLMRGVIVALGTSDAIDSARESMREFENVMFLDARPDQIPWRDGYFTKILVPPHIDRILRYASAELHRVLAPGGEIVSTALEA
ncbi:MAG: hypothetical protein WB992_17035 [Bryobacteraceae bacterium]